MLCSPSMVTYITSILGCIQQLPPLPFHNIWPIGHGNKKPIFDLYFGSQYNDLELPLQMCTWCHLVMVITKKKSHSWVAKRGKFWFLKKNYNFVVCIFMFYKIHSQDMGKWQIHFGIKWASIVIKISLVMVYGDQQDHLK